MDCIIKVYWERDGEWNSGQPARVQTMCGQVRDHEIEGYRTDNEAHKDAGCAKCVAVTPVHILRRTEPDGEVIFACGDRDLIANAEYDANFEITENSQWREREDAPTSQDCAECVETAS